MNMQQNRMNDGSNKLSYAQNSLLQTNIIAKAFPVIKDALEGLYSTMTPICVNVAELGCANGPNTLMLIPELVHFTYKKFRETRREIPQIQIFLNDQCYNDFNEVSRSLTSFRAELDKKRCGDVGQLFISMTPGTFHKRIFPDNFLHLVHCANGVHWLSQIPNVTWKGDEDIYITKTSNPEVIRAYQQQFAKDFDSFLKSRAQEIVGGGWMVINIVVSSDSSEIQRPEEMWMFKLMNMLLKDMLLEGLVDKKKVSEFKIPIYPPTMEEVKEMVSIEGSFLLHKHETFTINWNTLLKEAKFVADTTRAATEYMISTQFGEAFAKEFYRRFTKLVHENFVNGFQFQTFHEVISLTRKCSEV